MNVKLRFASDEDMLRFEPSLESYRPRFGRNGEKLHDWDVQHQLAMNELERRLKNIKSVGEEFEIGRLGLRSQERLRECAACLALHYLFIAVDTQGDDSGFFARKAAHYYTRAHDIFQAEGDQLDYDLDRDGGINQEEKDQPFVPRVIRG